MKRRAEHEAGYVLHTYPYKETSLIVEAFTRRFGRVAMLARGARRPRSAMRGVLLSFHPLRLSWSAPAELGNLISAEWSGGLRPLAGRGLMCGFYVNELVLRLLPRDDPHEALFDSYGETLSRLVGDGPFASVLRGFEKRLLAELGYAPLLDRDAASGAPIDPQARYVYEPDRGPMPVRNSHASDLLVSGRTLLDVAADDYARPETRDEARTLLRALIHIRLNLEMAATDEMVGIARRIKPEMAMLVPEGRHEITTEGGLDIASQEAKLRQAVARLAEAGIVVSVFIDAEARQVEAAGRIGAAVCEVHTGPYAHAFHSKGRDDESPAVVAELERIRRAGEAIRSLGMRFNAGHALNYFNVEPVARLPGVRELHIGHAIVSRAVFVGMREAVREMKQLMLQAVR